MQLYFILAAVWLLFCGCASTSTLYGESYEYPYGPTYDYIDDNRYQTGPKAVFEDHATLRYYNYRYYYRYPDFYFNRFWMYEIPDSYRHHRFSLHGRSGVGSIFYPRPYFDSKRYLRNDLRLGPQQTFGNGTWFHRGRQFGSHGFHGYGRGYGYGTAGPR